MDRVAGRVALITGAARGQGRAHAVRLAEEGADIIAVDVCAPMPVPYDSSTPEDLAQTVKEVQALGRRVVPLQVDVRDLGALRRGVDEAVSALGRLDVVVANAGVCVPSTWDQVTPELLELHLSTNITGTWNTVMVGAPHLIQAGGGSIILISSAAGITVQPFLVAYCTSKFAVRGMAKAFAVELGEHKIRVNSVHPCAVQTPMAGGGVLGVIGDALEAHPQLGAMFNNILPHGQAEPIDIANTVLFLASDESRFYTAHELAPDAGVTEY